MTIEKIMSDSTFKEKYVLEKFLMHFLELSREDLWLKSDEEIAEDRLQKIIEAYKKYVEDKQPMEYILGYVEFFDTKFFVNENTLIPRPETEYMILAVSEFISEQGIVNSEKFSNVLIDLGTGCGVLGCSVLLQNPGVFDNIFFTDISEGALDVARRNYENLLGGQTPLNLPLRTAGETSFSQNVEFLESDLLSFWDGNGSFDKLRMTGIGDIVIVANLPYIPDEMFDENSPDNVKNHEPRFAFVGGEDGLDLYRKTFQQIKEMFFMDSLTSSEGQKITMFLEMMTWQVDILRKEFDWLEFEEVKTFHFNIRIVKCWLK